MPKFRKRPVVIEAFQMTKERRWDNSEWPGWLHEAWQKANDDAGAFYCDSSDLKYIYIHTLEGHHRVTYGDWIIQGISGELYPCKPYIFDATYEPVEADDEG